ncbi:MAG: FAD-binding protein, partial [Plantibacter flavus]
RFCDEGLGGIDMANKLARRDDPFGVVICDADVWNGAAGASAVVPPANPELVERGGTLHRADTIRELAELAGLPSAGVEATVDELNAFAEGVGPLLRVPRSATNGPLRGLRVPPFVAIPVAPGMTFTMGGPLIDRRARVRSGEGGTIPGLYAVGSAAGGFDGGHDVGYAGGLIRGVVTGLAAAEDLAANRRS